MPTYAPAITVGNDYGNLQANQQAKDQFIFAQIQNAQRQQQEAQSQQMQQQQFAQRQSQENQRQASDEYYRSIQSQQNQATEQADKTDSANRFAAQLAQRSTEDTQAENDFQASLKAKLAQSGQTQTDADYNEAFQAIQKGDLKDATQIQTMFPSLTPVHVDRLTAYMKEIAAQKNEDYKGLEAGAQGLNAQVDAARRAKAVSALTAEQTKNPAHFYNNLQAQYDAQAKAIPSLPVDKLPPLNQADVDPIESGISKNPRLAQSVQFDPVTQRMVPVMRQPNYRFNPPPQGSGIATNAPATYPFTPPAPAGLPQTSTVVNPAASQPVAVQSQAQFDALPLGALFINPADGKTYRKKAPDVQP